MGFKKDTKQLVHLDTSYLIRALNPVTEEAYQVRSWLASSTPLAMSTIAWYEFCCGPLNPRDLETAYAKLSHGVLAFLQPHAEESARLYNALGRGTRLQRDTMIAATAIVEGATLVTANTGDFLPFVPLGLDLFTV